MAISFVAKDALQIALENPNGFGCLGLLIPGRRITSSDIDVVVRPAGEGRLSGRVDLVESLGNNTLIHANVAGSTAGGVQIVAAQSTRTHLHAGDPVGLDILPSSFHLFDRQGRTVGRAPAQAA